MGNQVLLLGRDEKDSEDEGFLGEEDDVGDEGME